MARSALSVAVISAPRVVHRTIGRIVGGQRPSAHAPVVVDGLAARDRQDPTVQLVRLANPGVGPQRGAERLLEDVVGVLRPDRHRQEPMHRRPVGLEERLERREACTSCHQRFLGARPARSSRRPGRAATASRSRRTRSILARWDRSAILRTQASSSIGRIISLPPFASSRGTTQGAPAA
jgi:hypothetical protein